MKKRKLLLHIVTCLACFVLGLICLTPASAVVSASETTSAQTLVAGEGFTAVTEWNATISDTVKAEYPNAAIKAGAAANESDTNLPKVYFNTFTRGCAGVIKFTTPIDVAEYSAITFEVSKNMSAQVTLDFYRNETGVVIGETASAQTATVTVGSYDKSATTRQTVTLQLENFADENGKVDSFIVVHTDDARAEGDYAGFTLNLYAINLWSTDTLDIVAGVIDMTVSSTTATGAMASPTGMGTSTAKQKLYVNGFMEYTAFELNFSTPIDTNTYKNLVLNVLLTGRQVSTDQYWSSYIDLFKAGTTTLNHSGAIASYSIYQGFASAMVVDLADFADEDGYVSSLIFYCHDLTSLGVTAEANPINMEIYASRMLKEEVTQMSKVDSTADVYFWAMPDKKDEDKVFVGWDVNGELYGAFNLWPAGETEETVTATPVYIDFYMKNGASVRLKEPTGIRWQTYISAEAYEYINSMGTLTFGTTVKCAGSTAELNIANTGRGWYDDVNTSDNTTVSHHFNAAMTNMEGYYETKFIATGYVDITYETGRTMRIWAAQGDNERSIQQVATTAKENIGVNGFNPTDDQIDWLDKYIAGDVSEEA